MAFKSILDPTFRYRNAANTDVRKTFERVRRLQQLQQQRKAQRDARSSKVIGVIAPSQRKTA